MDLWAAAPENDRGRLFAVWLSPFRDKQAQEAVLAELERLASGQVLLPTFTTIQLLSASDDEAVAGPIMRTSQSSIARAMRSYRNTGVGRAVVVLPTPGALGQLVAAGLSHRIDPVRPISAAAPGEGADPPDALESFKLLLDDIDFREASPSLGPNSAPQLTIRNVVVSIRPEIMLSGRVTSGAPLVAPSSCISQPLLHWTIPRQATSLL